MDEFEVVAAEQAAPEVHPDLPVSEGIADAVIAPPVEVAPEPEPAPEPTPEPLNKGEVIAEPGAEPVYSFKIGDVTYHHIRNASDGRWIYAPTK